MDAQRHRLDRGDEVSYRIEYQPIKKVRGVEKRRSPRAALTGLCFLLLFLLVQLLWPDGRQVLKGMLFSGDEAVTALAVEDFARNLGAGVRVTEAFELLCRTIMGGSTIVPN